MMRQVKSITRFTIFVVPLVTVFAVKVKRRYYIVVKLVPFLRAVTS